MQGKTIDGGAMPDAVSLDDRVPKNHPLRRLRVLVDAVLSRMDKGFGAVYAPVG